VTSEPTDEELMERFVGGDARAFDLLFSRHAGNLRRYLQRMSGSASVADDLTQITFVSMVKGRGRFQKGAKVKPWLYAIATNAARDWRRRTKFESVSSDGKLPEGEAEPGVQRDPGLEKAVKNALQQLPEAQREAIVLNRYEGLSFAEIAEIAGVTESAVKVRAFRGYERLRELLKGVWS
jgi:RNA polymerase sigma-70 factor (ECF subfamily)